MKRDYPYSIAGTTASLLCIKDSQVFVANVGDSDIVMAIKNHKFGEHGEPPLKAVKLTEEHTPKNLIIRYINNITLVIFYDFLV